MSTTVVTKPKSNRSVTGLLTTLIVERLNTMRWSATEQGIAELHGPRLIPVVKTVSSIDTGEPIKVIVAERVY